MNRCLSFTGPVRPFFVRLGPLVAIGLVALAASCRRSPAPSAADAGVASADADGGDLADATTTAAEVREEVDAASPSVPIVAAMHLAPVFSATEWPPHDPTRASDERKGVIRLGYMRLGTHTLAKPGKIKKGNCAEGWYELVEGGFVCGKFVTEDENDPRLKNAPHEPYADAPLPYDYGLNLTPGTPLYRRVPLKRERKEVEKTLAIGKGVKASDVVKKLRAQGEEVPAYLKDVGSDGKPRVAFDDLKGETGLVVEHMLRGFYLGLDKKVSAYSGTFWRTTYGYFVPKDHVLVHESKTEFEGVRLDSPDEKRKLPLAFVIGTRAHGYSIGEKKDGKPGEKRALRHADRIERFTIVSLTDKHEVAEDRNYYETVDGYWVRDLDVAMAHVPKPPADLAPGEKWIDVDLGNQALVAMEGDKPVYATIVSTGRHDKDPAKDHTTPAGEYRIREKHVSTTMDDDGASDGTYRIEDVPWVMYFEKSYALHGAFWHSSFGREKSHGCVNMTPFDARHVFEWAGPTLPAGWHGVRATAANPGTRVIVHP